MALFDTEFERFSGACRNGNPNVDFACEAYPPRVVLTKEQTLFDVGVGREETRSAEIVVIGGLEPEITVKGAWDTTKKEWNKLVNGAAELLNIYLHAYMQDHIEYDRAMRMKHDAEEERA